MVQEQYQPPNTPDPLPAPPVLDTEAMRRRASINITLTVVMPLIVGASFAALAAWMGAAEGIPAGAMFLVGAVFAAPAAIGYAISLRWKRTHPAGYVCLGLAFTIVTVMALGALAFAGCSILVMLG